MTTTPQVPGGDEPLLVCVHELSESNGKTRWSVMLHKADGGVAVWDGHQVYSDEIKGRAQYEADCLRAFLQGTARPFILDYDTDATLPEPAAAPAPPTLREMADDLHEAGHAFWQACRQAGGGAVRWLDFTDGTLILFTRGEYRETLLQQATKDYAAPVVVFEDKGGDEDGISAVSAKVAAAPAAGEPQEHPVYQAVPSLGLHATEGRAETHVSPPTNTSGRADPLYAKACAIVRAQKRGSISTVQLHLRIGYYRAVALLKAMVGDVLAEMPPTTNLLPEKAEPVSQEPTGSGS